MDVGMNEKVLQGFIFLSGKPDKNPFLCKRTSKPKKYESLVRLRSYHINTPLQ